MCTGTTRSSPPSVQYQRGPRRSPHRTCPPHSHHSAMSLQTLTCPSCSGVRMLDTVYRRSGMLIPPFQMQVPIPVGMDTSFLVQLLHLPLPPGCCCSVPRTRTRRTRTARRGSSTWARSPRRSPQRLGPAVPRVPLYTALHETAARIGLDEVISHGAGSPRRFKSHTCTHPDSGPTVTAMEIERLASRKRPTHPRGQQQYDNLRCRCRGPFPCQPNANT